MNIYLMGYRATGKSTAGRLLAERMQRHFVDVDDLIVKKAGKIIARIFEEDGEEHFRDLESQALADVAQKDNLVVALGGGTILRLQNRALLKASGRTAWLKAPVEVIQRRLNNDDKTAANRPALSGANAMDEVVEVLRVRTPLYEESMDFSVDAAQPIETVVQDIFDYLKEAV